METVKRDKEISLSKRTKIREMNMDEFIETHASGTLRKNKRIGFAYKDQYYKERTCYEFGSGFEILPKSYIVFGDAFTEGDNHFITEAGWFIERYLNLDIFDDYFEAKYIIVTYKDGSQKEGIGIVVRETSAQWVPSGHIVFAIVAEFSKEKNQFINCVNPS